MGNENTWVETEKAAKNMGALIASSTNIDDFFSYAVIIDKESQEVTLGGLWADVFRENVEADDQYMSIISFVHHDDQQKIIDAIHLMNSGYESRKSMMLRIKTGQQWVEHNVRLYLIQLEGKESILGFAFPGNSVGMAEELHQSLEKAELVNRLVVEGAADYIYHLDLVNNRCTFSPHALEVLPLKAATFDHALETCLSFIVPDDRQLFLDTMAPFLAGTSQYHNAEYRVHTVQGNIMWMSCRGKGIHDEQGRPIMIAGSLLDITEKKQYEQHMEQLAITDQLTGLYNRHKFNLDMNQNIDHCTDKQGAVLFIDLDDFKVFNDLFGHNFGDKILVAVAAFLKEFFPEEVDLYRIGGDEFVVHWKDADSDMAKVSYEQLIEGMKNQFNIGGNPVYITFSMGIALYPEHGDTAEEIVKKADIAMYTAKKEGKNNIALYVESNYEEISRRFILETELRYAVDCNYRGFALHYQPIVDAKDGRWIGAEALLRWQSPTLGVIPPNEVVSILEYIGLMVNVGEWIIDEAVSECAKWHKAAMNDLFAHVNLSIVQIDDPQLKQHILKTLEKYQLPSENLYLEITEGTIIKNLTHAMEFCKAMQEHGIRIALDDFGTGYSSLSYLRKIPLDEIKIDKSFLENFEHDAYNRAIVSSLCDLAHTIQLKVCVEGVEEERHWDVLKKMNVDVLQGYFFSKPMTAEAFLLELNKMKK